jgi:hypothetical protein
MINLITAALVAAAPAAPAQATHAQHKMGQNEQRKGMDCCKDGCKGCCKDMAGHKADKGEHDKHPAR